MQGKNPISLAGNLFVVVTQIILNGYSGFLNQVICGFSPRLIFIPQINFVVKNLNWGLEGNIDILLSLFSPQVVSNSLATHGL